MPDIAHHNAVIPEIDVEFLFRRRPVAIPADLRPSWRVAVIVLLLRKCCRQNRSGFTRLHVLSWGVRTIETRNALIAAAAGDIPPNTLLVRIEPSLNRAVNFALGEGLLRRVSGDKVELTPSGITFADQLDSNVVAFSREKAFMDSVGRRITESLVTQMFGKGS